MLDLDQRYRFAQDGVRCSAETALQGFQHALQVLYKGDKTPVTKIDRRIEEELQNKIAQAFPHDGFLGEEGQSSQIKNPTWLVDPLDGTKSYISGNPLFGVLLGFCVDTRCVLGAVAMPALGEVWSACTGKEALYQGRQIRCMRRVDSLKEAVVWSTSPDNFMGEERLRYESLCSVALGRNFGGDCHSYLRCAAGWLDLVVESGLKVYDILPLVPILAQSGAILTDWEGQEIVFSGDRHQTYNVVASNNLELHRQALACLKE